ncbi:MAG: tetratricopeptide repeat protein [Planctomycetota bacterium]|jgi:tetratricopeptide (TPR) repeat protein
MSPSYSTGQEFVAQVGPLIEAGNQEDLIEYLSRHWPNDRLCSLLDCGYDEAVITALTCLSLTGTMANSADISRFLHHGDDRIAELAEEAMWAVWFRAGDEHTNESLEQAIKLINDDKIDRAIELLNSIIHQDPAFAEAYNQRAIAYYLKGDYLKAIDDCKEALRLNEYHFCAMADLGHGYASLGQLEQALEAYRGSLQLHPRQKSIQQTIQVIEQCVD